MPHETTVRVTNTHIVIVKQVSYQLTERIISQNNYIHFYLM